jgi:DNA-binding MarR family transcriptional regulator
MGRRGDSGLQAWRALLLAYNAAMRAIDAELVRAHAIPLTWYDVLLELNATADRRLRMQELADQVVLSRTRVSRLVDDIAAAGLVTKTRSEDDRRVVWATITERGRAELKATAPLYLRGIRTHFASHLTTDEQALVAAALTKVVAAHSTPVRLSASARQPPPEWNSR